MDYKTVFQLAQDKGFSSNIDDQRTEDYLKCAEIQKWLRDEHKIDVTPSMAMDTRNERSYFSNCYYIKKGKSVTDVLDIINKCERKANTKTHEAALLEGINEALKLIKHG